MGFTNHKLMNMEKTMNKIKVGQMSFMVSVCMSGYRSENYFPRITAARADINKRRPERKNQYVCFLMEKQTTVFHAAITVNYSFCL